MKTKFQPIFSVVIPVYGVEKYIKTCIRSVLNQTFKSFEIVCVDDGSPDRSVELIEEFDDARIRIVRQQNMGLAAARNTGINAARGIFIALLDSDDFWEAEKLSLHFKHMQQDPRIGISYSGSNFVNDEGKALGIGQHPKLQNISAKDIFCRNPIGNGSAPVLRRAMLQEIGMPCVKDGQYRIQYFDENMRQSEDVEFWLRVALKTDFKIEGIEGQLTNYRVNMSGLSANLQKQYDSWLYSVRQNQNIDADFISKWFPLAAAYQKRYLARRAVQSRNSATALRLLCEAIVMAPGILKEEPKRTLVTFAAALASLLPQKLYDKLERAAMQNNTLAGA